MFFFFLMIRRPPRSTRTDTLLPYTTLFRSDFLTKPVRDQTLLDAVTAGLERDIAERASAEVVQQHVERFATLTPRESQVMREVSMGRLTTQIAYDLGITEITVKIHRSNVMKKMQASSVGELIRAWEKLPHELPETAPHYHLIW